MAARAGSRTSTITLAATEFKLRFFGSVLGYLWQLVRPLLLFGVLYIVFTQFVKIGGPVAFYPVVLLANIVLYTFFSEGTSAVNSVVQRENLVRKIQFPRMAIPVSVVLTAAFNLTLNLLVVLRLRARRGRPAALDVARDPVPARRAGAARDRPGDAALGAVRALPGRQADLGGHAPADLLRDPDHLRDRDDRRVRSASRSF